MVLEVRWSEVEGAPEEICNTDSNAVSDPTSAVRTSASGQDDILDELASEDAFGVATDCGQRVRELGAGRESDTFSRVKWSTTARRSARGPRCR